MLSFRMLFLMIAGLLASRVIGMVSEGSDWFDAIDLVGAGIDYVEDNINLFTPPIAGLKRTREKCGPTDYWGTTWGKLIIDLRRLTADPSVDLARTKGGKIFRRRFRVPFQLFDEVILPECERVNLFGTACERKVRVPTPFKILMALRILGRGSTCDDIAELSGGSESTANSVFKTFIIEFAKHFAKEFIRPPSDLTRTKKSFARIGMPGGLGSMNGTHCPWDRCPVSLYHFCKGKEKYPSVAFNVIVDHFKYVHHLSEAFFGATNDITMAHLDSYPKEMREGKFADVEFELYDKDGIKRLCKGGYVIVDGGLPKEGMFQNPMTERVSRGAVLCSEWMESVRKDVEGFFGILKMRFRFLKNYIVYHGINVIEAAMTTACILHNMLLVFDCMSIDSWEDVDWEQIDPDANDEDFDDTEADIIRDLQAKELADIDSDDEEEMEEEEDPEEDMYGVAAQSRPIRCYGIADHEELQRDLVINFEVQYAKGEVFWPKRFDDRSKQRLPRKPPALQRTETEVVASLYHMTSTYRLMSNKTLLYTREIGDGLFSTMALGKNMKITQFHGELCTDVEYAARVARNEGGYGIQRKKGIVLDCRSQYLQGKCMASFANSPTNSWDTVTKKSSKANCSIRPHPHVMNVVSLWTKDKIIPAHTELSWCYSNAFEYPEEDD